MLHIEPVIDKFPEDTYASEGEGVLLKVSVQGNPKPSITWYFEGSQLKQDNCIELQADGTLFISFTQLKHSGFYRLVARNSVGTTEKTFKLFVKLRDLRRILTLNSNDMIKPVPLRSFGDYVAYNHLHDNKGFRNQFMVQ